MAIRRPIADRPAEFRVHNDDSGQTLLIFGAFLARRFSTEALDWVCDQPTRGDGHVCDSSVLFPPGLHLYRTLERRPEVLAPDATNAQARNVEVNCWQRRSCSGMVSGLRGVRPYLYERSLGPPASRPSPGPEVRLWRSSRTGHNFHSDTTHHCSPKADRGARPQEGKTNLSRDGLNPAHVPWYGWTIRRLATVATQW